MSIKYKNVIFGFITILASILVIFYIASNTVKSGNNNVLTIDKIKENYKEGTIKDIKQFDGESGSQYALVNYVGEYNKNLFEIYNLKTGDRDIFPTNPD